MTVEKRVAFSERYLTNKPSPLYTRVVFCIGLTWPMLGLPLFLFLLERQTNTKNEVAPAVIWLLADRPLVYSRWKQSPSCYFSYWTNKELLNPIWRQRAIWICTANTTATKKGRSCRLRFLHTAFHFRWKRGGSKKELGNCSWHWQTKTFVAFLLQPAKKKKKNPFVHVC